MKELVELWAIDEKWGTIEKFNKEEDVFMWLSTKPKFFQVLYRINCGPIHVYLNS